MKLRRIPRVEIRRTEYVECSDQDLSVTGPHAALPLLRDVLRGFEQEIFIAVMLDSKGRATAWREIARGTSSSVVVPVRELFRTALMCDAHRLIVAHNHPSGDPTPSQEDNMVTAQLKEAGALLNCPLLDHIIVTDSHRFYSFANEGRLRSM